MPNGGRIRGVWGWAYLCEVTLGEQAGVNAKALTLSGVHILRES